MPVPLPPEYRYRARLSKVVDGDTLELDMDLGFDVHRTIRARLVDVWAPELGTPAGETAKQWVADWLMLRARDVRTPELYVQTFVTRTGSDLKTFDRYVAAVVWAATGDSLNAAITAWLAGTAVTG